MRVSRLTVLVFSAFVLSGIQTWGHEVPRDTSFTRWSTYLHIRKKHPEAKLLPDTVPHGVRVDRNVAYTEIKDSPYDNRCLRADVFRPDNDSVYPALIMIHGGGWNSGDKTLQHPMAQRIASRGYVTIPVEYRLIPEALYPAGMHDIKTAVRWVRKNARSLGVDPDRIAVSGCSAGGQMAVLAGVTNGSARHEGAGEWGDVSSDVQAVIDMDGVSTFVSEHNIADAIERLAVKGTLPISAVWLGGLYSDARDNWEEASAVNWVTSASAPVCVIKSGLPRYTDGVATLLSDYKSRGIYYEEHSIPVDLHAYWFFSPWAEQAIDIAVDYLDKVFKKAR